MKTHQIVAAALVLVVGIHCQDGDLKANAEVAIVKLESIQQYAEALSATISSGRPSTTTTDTTPAEETTTEEAAETTTADSREAFNKDELLKMLMSNLFEYSLIEVNDIDDVNPAIDYALEVVTLYNPTVVTDLDIESLTYAEAGLNYSNVLLNRPGKLQEYLDEYDDPDGEGFSEVDLMLENLQATAAVSKTKEEATKVVVESYGIEVGSGFMISFIIMLCLCGIGLGVLTFFLVQVNMKKKKKDLSKLPGATEDPYEPDLGLSKQNKAFSSNGVPQQDLRGRSLSLISEHGVHLQSDSETRNIHHQVMRKDPTPQMPPNRKSMQNVLMTNPNRNDNIYY